MTRLDILLLGVRPVPHDMRRGPITCRFGTVSRSEIKVISRRELQSTVLTEVVVCIEHRCALKLEPVEGLLMHYYGVI